jgi:hypothetical protein
MYDALWTRLSRRLPWVRAHGGHTDTRSETGATATRSGRRAGGADRRPYPLAATEGW